MFLTKETPFHPPFVSSALSVGIGIKLILNGHVCVYAVKCSNSELYSLYVYMNENLSYSYNFHVPAANQSSL